MSEFSGDMLRSLRRAVSFYFFRPVSRYGADPDPSLKAILALIGLDIAADAGLQAAAAGQHQAVSAWGFAVAAMGWCALVLALWLCRPRSARFGLPMMVADFAAISFFSALALSGSYLIGEKAGVVQTPTKLFVAITAAIVVWWLAALWRAGRTVWTGSEWRFGLRPALYSLLVAIMLPFAPMVRGDSTRQSFDIWQTASVYWWYYTQDTASVEEDDDYKPVDVEAAYYKQTALVASALDKLKPSDPARSEIYLVAGAGYASQDVFRSEVIKTQALFDERFGTRGRSIIAINHRDTVEDVPLANTTNLQTLLAGVGAKMDKNNDVLVLFLTSHGNKKRFSVSFPGFSFNDLTPEALRGMLDAAQIKNRVLIISACYSGSFIPALQNDDTLIMTAASDSRSSFGCSNEREWTFFGDALMNRALRDTFSFEEAFAKARETVRAWENEQKSTPSDPQIFVGPAIRERLAALALELAADAPKAIPRAEIRAEAN